jgi:hypothetical protein
MLSPLTTASLLHFYVKEVEDYEHSGILLKSDN